MKSFLHEISIKIDKLRYYVVSHTFIACLFALFRFPSRVKMLLDASWQSVLGYVQTHVNFVETCDDVHCLHRMIRNSGDSQSLLAILLFFIFLIQNAFVFWSPEMSTMWWVYEQSNDQIRSLHWDDFVSRTEVKLCSLCVVSNACPSYHQLHHRYFNWNVFS